MATSTTTQFLSSINEILRTRNARQLQDYLLVEPPLPEIYSKLRSELRAQYPSETDEGDAMLSQMCNDLLPEGEEQVWAPDEAGAAWPAFVLFMKEYLQYLRDVNVENLLETHDLLSSLVNQCITALSHPSMGIVVLPACLSLSAALARLAVNLERRPELTAHLIRRSSVLHETDDPDFKKTLVEDTAELLQRAFTTCLTEKSASATGIGPNGRPEGKKIAIYSFANLVLKLLFQCRNTRLASQVFTNISQQSPPLSAFPASQRVAYLYYLGRYYFANNHFYRALVALDGAYHQCNSRCLQQRHRILVYLITANIIMGRFPSRALLERPDAVGLGQKFLPLCQAIARGDMAGFKESLNGEHKTWFLAKGLLLPLSNRCEVLLWRSLARKTFLLSGNPGGEDKKAPTFPLTDLLHLIQVLDERARNREQGGVVNGQDHDADSVDSDFEGADEDDDLNEEEELEQAEQAEQMEDEEVEEEEEEDVETENWTPSSTEYTITDVEAMCASLIDQGLLHGFLSHKLLRFAIIGAKAGGALSAGFPPVWHVLEGRARQNEEGDPDSVPGWVKPGRAGLVAGRAIGPGMVINLSGARPAGTPPD